MTAVNYRCLRLGPLPAITVTPQAAVLLRNVAKRQICATLGDGVTGHRSP